MSILLSPWLISAFLGFYIGWDWAKKQRDKNKVKSNSQIFDPRFDNIWRNAANDWVTNEDDERSFEDFFGDTINLCTATLRRPS